MFASLLFHRIPRQVIGSLALYGISGIALGQTPPPATEPSGYGFMQPSANSAPFHDPNICSRCQNGASCVPGMADYPVLRDTFGNPYRLWDCRSREFGASKLHSWKRSMQASHWGYPEHFNRDTYGYANRLAFGKNIRAGAIDRATLYLMDFYPEDSTYAHMLTPQGLERLEKAICVSNTTSTPVQFEQSSQPKLDALRLQWLASHPSIVASGMGPESIHIISKPTSIQGIEAIRRYQQGISTSSSQGIIGGASPSGFPFSAGLVPPTGTSSTR